MTRPSVKPVLDLRSSPTALAISTSASPTRAASSSVATSTATIYAQRGSLAVVEDVLAGRRTLMPSLSRLRVLRQWGGVMDMSMDGNPIISRTPVENVFLNGGWCYGGFKAIPDGGWSRRISRDGRTASAWRSISASSASARGGRSTSGASALPGFTERARADAQDRLPFCGPRDEVEFRYRGDAEAAAAGRWPRLTRSSAMSMSVKIRTDGTRNGGSTSPAAGAS